VGTEAASGVTSQAATLNGTVNPHALATTDIHFEYGQTTAYGATAPVAGPITGSSPSAVQAAVSGLSPATTYHVRLVASTAKGTTEGPDRTFTTAGAMPPPADTTTPGPVFTPTPPSRVTLRGTARPRRHRTPTARVVCVVTSGASCELRFATAAGRRLRARLAGAAGTLRGATPRARRGRLVIAGPPRLEAGRYTLRLRVGQGRRAKRYRLRLTLR
jgi:hypothetical protein